MINYLGSVTLILLIGLLIGLWSVFLKRFCKSIIRTIIYSIISFWFMIGISDMSVALSHNRGGIFRYAPLLVIIVYLGIPIFFIIFQKQKNK